MTDSSGPLWPACACVRVFPVFRGGACAVWSLVSLCALDCAQRTGDPSPRSTPQSTVLRQHSPSTQGTVSSGPQTFTILNRSAQAPNFYHFGQHQVNEHIPKTGNKAWLRRRTREAAHKHGATRARASCADRAIQHTVKWTHFYRFVKCVKLLPF